VLAAGCDIALHCSGDMAEMEAIADAVGPIGDQARARLDRAMATVAGRRDDIAASELIAKRDALLAILPT
jgi:beta-N-acetylhexosaminidase